MNGEARSILAEALIAQGDDEVILAHRDGEWAGHAPILEEDIAFANIALDELGHATVWYRLAADLQAEDPDSFPDRLVFHRPADAFRNARLVELPRGDWAFTVVRQYFFDAAEGLRLKSLMTSEHRPLAEAASKILTEERYHARHMLAWVRRLGLGTDESRRRMQSAVDQLWPLAGQLLAPMAAESGRIPTATWPGVELLANEWETAVRSHLRESGLELPEGPPPPGPGRDVHTEHLPPLVEALQSVARLEPDAAW